MQAHQLLFYLCVIDCYTSLRRLLKHQQVIHGLVQRLDLQLAQCSFVRGNLPLLDKRGHCPGEADLSQQIIPGDVLTIDRSDHGRQFPCTSAPSQDRPPHASGDNDDDWY